MLIFFKLVSERDELGWAYNIGGHMILYRRGMGADPVLYKHILSLFDILQEMFGDIVCTDVRTSMLLLVT